jgi:hypothetical protein
MCVVKNRWEKSWWKMVGARKVEKRVRLRRSLNVLSSSWTRPKDHPRVSCSCDIVAGLPFDANHPFHLHGHNFRVIAMERMASNVTLEDVKTADREGRIHRKLDRAPLKDTVTVPDGGYTIIRFIADNPGTY